MNTYTINDTGLGEIRDFLFANHKRGPELFPEKYVPGNCLPSVYAMLCAWAQNAEFQLEEGNTATIELSAFDSVTGVAQEFTVPDVGIDIEPFEEDET